MPEGSFHYCIRFLSIMPLNLLFLMFFKAVDFFLSKFSQIRRNREFTPFLLIFAFATALQTHPRFSVVAFPCRHV